MKKLGLIGGTGPESTVIYYERVLRGIQQATGTDVVAPMTIENLSYLEVFRYMGDGDLDGLADYLLAGIRSLADAGCDLAAMTAFTTHAVFDRVAADSPIPLVSAVDATVRASAAYDTVALLGTEFTMTSTFVTAPIEAAGTRCVVPNDEEISYIQRKLTDEVERGIITQETIDGVAAIVERLAEQEGAQLAILGCTELPLLFDGVDLAVPKLDTIDAHIEDLVAAVV